MGRYFDHQPLFFRAGGLLGGRRRAAYAVAALCGLVFMVASPFAAWANTTDYDTDDDNLIEITTHAQLNAIRWDTDGNGTSSNAGYATAFPNALTGMGCAATCAGYELSNDIDLDTNGNGRADSGDAYWNSGSGWNPIGSFNTTLKGNGNAIEGLYVNRTTTQTHGSWEVGFFTSLGGSSLIEGIVFHDVDVYGAATHGSNSAAEPYVGAVAGKLASGGNIRNVTVTGRVRGYLQSTNDSTYQAHAGGVVGNNGGTIDRAFSGAYVEAVVGNYRHANAGGIAGENPGTIIASWFTGYAYAHGASGQESRAGGIAAYMTWSAGSVKASYSTGKVEAANGSRRGGGIVGYLNDGTVQASWAAGTVIATTQRGGITGNPSGGTVTDSYYDSTVITGSLNGQGTAKTTTELQTPTAYGTGTSIYANWNLNLDGVTGNDDPWDFGTSSQYPAIKYKSTSTTGQRAAELGQVTGLAATNPGSGTQLDLAWTAVTGAEGYVVRWKSGTEAYSAARQITIASQSTVTASITGLTSGTAYTIIVYAYKEGAANGASSAEATATPTLDLDTDDDNLIEVSTLAQLNAIRWDLDGNGTPSSGNESSYRTAFGTGSSNVTCHGTCAGYELRANLDFDTNGNGSADSGDTYWNSGAGFTPIGTGAFTAEFDGNSDSDSSGDGGPYHIANLHIDATTTTTTAGDYYAGLFANLGSAADGHEPRAGRRGRDAHGRVRTACTCGWARSRARAPPPSAASPSPATWPRSSTTPVRRHAALLRGRHRRQDHRRRPPLQLGRCGGQGREPGPTTRNRAPTRAASRAR